MIAGSCSRGTSSSPPPLTRRPRPGCSTHQRSLMARRTRPASEHSRYNQTFFINPFQFQVTPLRGVKQILLSPLEHILLNCLSTNPKNHLKLNLLVKKNIIKIYFVLVILNCNSKTDKDIAKVQTICRYIHDKPLKGNP